MTTKKSPFSLKLALVAFLAGVGQVGLIVSSFLTLPYIVYRGVADPPALRGYAILAASPVMIIAALTLGHTNQRWYQIFGILLSRVVFFGCLGVTRALLWRCLIVRSTPRMTADEIGLLTAAVGCMAVVLYLNRHHLNWRRQIGNPA